MIATLGYPTPSAETVTSTARACTASTPHDTHWPKAPNKDRQVVLRGWARDASNPGSPEGFNQAGQSSQESLRQTGQGRQTVCSRAARDPGP